MALLVAVVACTHAPAESPNAETVEQTIERCQSIERGEPAPRRHEERQTMVFADPEPIHRAFRRNRPRFDCCYRDLLDHRQSEHEGEVVLEVELDPDRLNRVRRTSVRSADPPLVDTTFHTCLESVGERMRIPEFASIPPYNADDSGSDRAGEDAGSACPRGARQGFCTPDAPQVSETRERALFNYPLRFGSNGSP